MTKTKRAVLFVLSVVACVFAVEVIKGAALRDESYNYELTATIVELDAANDLAVCEDYNGNLWEFYGVEGLKERDTVSLFMSSKGTESIYDDTIERVNYI